MRPLELRRIPLFATMTPADLAAVATVVEPVNYQRGTVLFGVGDPCAGISVVLDGIVRLFRRTPERREVTTGIVRAGGLMALCALCGEATHRDSAEALNHVHTVEIPTAALHVLGQRCPHLQEQAMRGLLERLDAVNAAFVIAQEQIPVQLLYLLRSVARLDQAAQRHPGDTMHPLALRLSHAELARLVGTDRATVTRALRLLEEQRLIQRKRGHVTGVVLSTPDRKVPV
ncbi:MAG: Crp/Fnr family transcriptional regulator [Chloroflexi bacterium]|nr:Crp/Fnr family transcriptional regulator [Chloroflexota bacterium]